jgi:hypothetical protein
MLKKLQTAFPRGVRVHMGYPKNEKEYTKPNRYTLINQIQIFIECLETMAQSCRSSF